MSMNWIFPKNIDQGLKWTYEFEFRYIGLG